MSAPIVFISYSHDSDGHRDQVLALSERLRADGVVTILDRYVGNGSPPEGWPRWMMNALTSSTHVLCVCTETYCRRFLGQETPDKGKGVDWEGALVAQALYDARSRSNKFIPVLFTQSDVCHVPEPLRSQTHYVVDCEAGYQALYDALLDQAGVEPGVVGELKRKPRADGRPLTFGENQGAPAGFCADISRIVRYAPSELIGREAETKIIDDAWAKVCCAEVRRPHVLTFVALGGEGKTSLVAKWAAEMAFEDWPGCDAAFAWTFYSQGTRDQAAASSDVFLKEALTFFGDTAMAESAQGASEKGRRLAQLVGERRALLILDGLEPLQYSPTSPTPGELKDQGLAALLKGLAANSRGLCIVTTRYSIPDLRAYRQTTAPELELLRLSKEAGVALLGQLGVKGNRIELETLVEDVKGHALTLNLLGSYLHDAHGGDVRRRDLIKLVEADAEEQGGHAFRAMDAYVKWLETGGKTAEENERGRRSLALLRLMGLFDRPATADCLEALWHGAAIKGLTEPLANLSEAKRNMALARLEEARLLTVNRDASHRLVSLDAHPLLREYFARQLREQQPDAWRAAHRRLYEHLCTATKEGDRPSLEDLQPLYQAVAHGCQAGLQQEACDKLYYARIHRGSEHYSTTKLGAFGSDLGAVACFFETLWSRVSPALTEADQAWLLNEAAYRLRALGRLTEALEPMRVSGTMYVKAELWKGAAISYGNMSGLKLTLGEVAGAVEDAKQCESYADRSDDAMVRLKQKAKQAGALHQAGRRAEARASFGEAEQMQAESQPSYPLLHSLRGFQYCDLLLAEVEREAGKAGRGGKKEKEEELLSACRAVEQRAAQTLKWATNENWLLNIALDHLTLGRAALYAAILGELAPRDSAAEIEAAVAGLRRSGEMDELPRGLLTRAWLRSLTGPRTGRESAQSDLDEAWEIAERGPMPLFQADIHLYRARLFFSEAAYPWDKHPDGTPRGPEYDLAEARRLIEKHGYLRRKEELEDAEEAFRRLGCDAE